ncbi:unnamed protein product [Rotaria sp. Silwood1]|nr:unnamed protein product [Rotaria sp. Silwood1]CAF1393383.1 unnamed protein product [Rotaria sp. Silwood1]CAF3543939.1 unnamed protein product [Rotaria sp. Silwood1]CAF3601743.1 unnamed protein product [Rotaria sp. Silwood1]CAF3631343.1 unnamed protein product [Rotaria sp. Silwood1]
MYLLNHRHTIEGRFVEIIEDCIRNQINAHQKHQACLENVHRLSNNYSVMFPHSNTNNMVFADDNEEYTEEDSSDDSYTDESDSYDDLENIVLDEIEMENDRRLFI